MAGPARGNCARGSGYLLYIQRGTEDQLMSVTLHRWGNSIGLRLPKPLLEQLGLGEGSKVDLRIEGGHLVIEPQRTKKLALKDVLAGFTPEDQPGEVGWGKPVGKEVW
jgi:antitoxin MazE